MHAEELIETLWPEVDPERGRNRLRNLLSGVTNPATMSTVSVATSADPKAISLPLTGATAMTANGQLSSTSAKATKVAYTATFATTGPLTNDASTLTLNSVGATFPLCSASGQYLFIDDTTGYETGLCPVSGSSAGPVDHTQLHRGDHRSR